MNPEMIDALAKRSAADTAEACAPRMLALQKKYGWSDAQTIDVTEQVARMISEGMDNVAAMMLDIIREELRLMGAKA